MGQFAREELVEDHAQGINIGAVVHCTGFRFVRVPCRPVCRSLSPEPCGATLVPFPGNSLARPKSAILDLAGQVDQDVLGFDVAVNDSLVVGILECRANLGTRAQASLGETPSAQDMAEVCALSVFAHDHEASAACAAEFVEGDDVGVVEPGEGFAFAFKSFHEAGLFG